MAAANNTKTVLKYVMGKCMPSLKTNAAKLQIPVYEFNDTLHMYFRKFEFIFAHDPYKMCKTGDFVLAQSLPENMSKLISHKVIEVIFPLGNVTDPITGKKVVGNKYRDEIKEANQIYGELENAFDYDKALPRGHLEDKRDFSHKPTYKKYYEDPNDPQPFAV